MVQKVKDAAGNKISHVLDTVASKDTQFASIKVLAEDKPGRVLIVLPHSEGIQDVRKDVHVASSVYPSFPNNPIAYEPLPDSDQPLHVLRLRLRPHGSRRTRQERSRRVLAEGSGVDQGRKVEKHPCEEVRRRVGQGRQRRIRLHRSRQSQR